ncbi:hypothetical protein B0H13DRAFT_2650196 [Mycena leptocephala]|nr:hypothetical protein B0H13DRAFT_2650196 [Mycena leptocephala]
MLSWSRPLANASPTQNIPEPNMRFTAVRVVSFLVAITAAYAGTIETRQGCTRTKVCLFDTVLNCCEGVNGPVDACLPRGATC